MSDDLDYLNPDSFEFPIDDPDPFGAFSNADPITTYSWSDENCDDGHKCKCDRGSCSGGCKKKPAPPGEDGVWCRKCGDFIKYGEPDNEVYGDGMLTCWECKHGFFAKEK